MPSALLTTKPIPLVVVQLIREHLQNRPRELAWFQLSLNTAFRGGDILSLLREDVVLAPEGHTEIRVREQKTGKIRTVVVNSKTNDALRKWLAVHPRKTPYLFEGQRGQMRTSYWTVQLKEWCKAVGYDEPRTATHSLRKTFVKTHYERGAKLATLMHMLNHASERQTLIYAGVMEEDVRKVYDDPI
jgi:integrase